MRITRLGEGVERTGRLADEAIRRTLDALEEFRRLMDRHRVVRARATATSAARDAENAAEFARRAAEVLGVEPEVLPGREEGRLAYLGATMGLDPAGGPYLVIDVGGGSTELVGGTGPGLEVASLELGCVRIERALPPPRPAGRRRARDGEDARRAGSFARRSRRTPRSRARPA